MDVRLSDEQEELRRSARVLLERECPMQLVRAAMDDARAAESLWERMAELGWMGLPFAREYGGAGLGWVDLAVLIEEMGRVLAPGPFFASMALAGPVVALAGDEPQRRRWLPGLASGARRATLALLEEVERWDAEGVRLPAERRAGAFVLSGRKRFVLEAECCDWIVVAARDTRSGEVVLLVVDRRAPGVSVRASASLDATRRLAEVRFDGASVPEDALLAAGAAALARALDHAKVALCAEMVGAAARVLEASVAYARTREQFGRPIGSFQAIQHRCADMLVALEGARSATWYAAWAVSEGTPEAAEAAAAAKAWTSDACAKIAGDGIQIHGGQGFTWEQDLHLYYRRAKVSERWFGDAVWNRELVARTRIDGARAGT
jgi:alkylation response protein AidB-like acyl-CoA dehydrogenase